MGVSRSCENGNLKVIKYLVRLSLVYIFIMCVRVRKGKRWIYRNGKTI